MEHLLLKASTVAADQGTFEAVISTASMDREGDVIEPAAVVAALQKWADLGKLVPLAWNHSDSIVGSIDPATARVDNGEVVAKGDIDRDAPKGEESWRLVKSGTLSFSFGFLAGEKAISDQPGGRYRFQEVDIFEISVVPVGPANNDTRVLNFKALELAKALEPITNELREVKERLRVLEDPDRTAEAVDEGPPARSADPLRKQAQRIALEVLGEGLDLHPVQQAAPAPAEPVYEPDALRKHTRGLMIQILSGATDEPLREGDRRD